MTSRWAVFVATFVLSLAVFAGFFLDAPAGWQIALLVALGVVLAVLHAPVPDRDSIVGLLAITALLASALVLRAPGEWRKGTVRQVDQGRHFALAARGWNYEKGWLWPAALGSLSVFEEIRDFSLKRGEADDETTVRSLIRASGWMTAALGALSTGLTLALGWRWASREVGWIAALLVAISPLAARVSHSLGPANLILVLGPLAVLLAIARPDEPSNKAAAGASAGLAASVHPVYAVLCLPIFAIRPTRKAALSGAVGFAAGFFVGRPALAWPEWPRGWSVFSFAGTALPFLAIALAWCLAKVADRLATRLERTGVGPAARSTILACVAVVFGVLWVVCNG